MIWSHAYGSQGEDCGGVNEKSCPQVMHLNTCFSANGEVSGVMQILEFAEQNLPMGLVLRAIVLSQFQFICSALYLPLKM